MSALLQGVPARVGGGAIFASEGTLAPDRVHNGIPYDANGGVAMHFGGAIDHHHQGLPFTAVGRLATGSGEVTYFGSGHTPFNASGFINGVNSVNSTHKSSGVAYNGVGRLNYQN